MGRADLSGRIFAGLTVLSVAPSERLPSGAIRTMWMCQCVCGSVRAVRTSNLISGNSISCGCRSRAVLLGEKKCRSCFLVRNIGEFDVSPLGRVRHRCRDCAKVKDEENIVRMKRSAPGRVGKHRNSLRQRAIDFLGAACSCCGEDRRVFLAVDHIHGGGSAEDRKIGTYGIYKRVLTDPDAREIYQALCHNCNWAKYHTGGNCPHKQPNWMPPPIGGGFFCVGTP